MKVLLLSLLAVILTVVFGKFGPVFSDEDLPLELRRKLNVPMTQVMRCSRRFTPGVCSDPVTSVWTYVFNKQNCIQRLGCPFCRRTNRFKTYSRCMRRCQPLTDIYTMILQYKEENNTGFSVAENENDNATDPIEVEIDIDESRRMLFSSFGTTVPDYEYDEEYKESEPFTEPGDNAFEPESIVEPEFVMEPETVVETDHVLEPDVDDFNAEDMIGVLRNNQ